MGIVGVDMSKDSFVAARWQDGHAQVLGTFAQSASGLADFQQALAPEQEVRVVLEPTGGYELAVALFAYEHGWQVCLPNPQQVRQWAKGMGRRAKTDRQDALMLACYGAERQPPPWHPLPAAVSELDQLLRRKQDLEGLLRQERNRLQHHQPRPGMPAAVPHSSERLIQVREDEIAQIEQAIHDHRHQHQDLAQLQRRLCTVPGVGAKNSLPLLVLLARWQTVTAGQGTAKGLTAYVG